jgi:hypothetical protein
MIERGSIVSFAAAACVSLTAAPAHAGSHTWVVTEVFSDPSGTIQFIEMTECCGGAGEIGVNGHSLTSNSVTTYVIPGPSLTPPTSNRRLLFATAAFACLPGAPTPNYIIPDNFFNPAGDTITYVPWNSWTFGPVPTNCTSSLQRDLTGNVTTGTNNPVNYAGTQGSVNACVCIGDVTPAGGNGNVDVNDLLTVITHWGPCAGSGCGDCIPSPCGNGTVDVNDLLGVITHWGLCQ